MPPTNVSEKATNLFSRSKTVSFATSALSGRAGLFATKLRTVAEAELPVGWKGGETMTR